MKTSQSLFALLSLVLVLSARSFSVGPGAAGGADTSSLASTEEHTSCTADNIGRRSALSNIFAAGAAIVVTSASSSPAYAGQADPALKGTKKDPAYEACLSKCLYECTKPKGEEQKSRAECIPECKTKCATTKEQLLTGTPIKKED